MAWIHISRVGFRLGVFEEDVDAAMEPIDLVFSFAFGTEVAAVSIPSVWGRSIPWISRTLLVEFKVGEDSPNDLKMWFI